MRRSRKFCCRRPACRRIPRRAACLHVRNDHANVQFRINGVMLPDGVTGFGSILRHRPDRQHVADHRRAAGGIRHAHGGPRRHHHAQRHFQQFRQRQPLRRQPRNLPAELRIWRHLRHQLPATTGMPTKAPSSSSTDCFPGVQYLFTGRYLQTTEGIENPLPTLNAIHDFSQQDKRLRLHVDLRRPVYAPEPDRRHVHQLVSDSQRSRPPVGSLGNPPVTSAFGITNFNSAQLNENQYENTQFGVLALQRSVNGFDGQLSYFTRYNFLHFMPDPVGDLLINGIASDITRQSYTNGIQGDASYVINRRTRCAPASPSAANKPGSVTIDWSKQAPLVGGVPTPTGDRSRSPTTSQSSAGSPASMSRTSGSSPTSST